MLNVKLTFDYEIHFGKNIKSYDDVLFDTTNRILDVLDRKNVKAVFFVDTLGYFKMEELNMTMFCKKMKEQCIDMLRRGHDIQLHIHAHWMSAEFDNKNQVWICEENKYRIQDYPLDVKERALDRSIDFLNDCAKIAKVNYTCNSFRAGGLILQPDKELIDLLVSRKIKYDSSIAINTFSYINYAQYDYRKCPPKLNWYFDSSSGCCAEASDHNHSLYEIPVATVRNNPIRYIFVKGAKRIYSRPSNGIGFIRRNQKTHFFTTIVRRICGYSWVSLDTRTANIIMSDLSVIYRKYMCKAYDYEIALLGHPKIFGTENVENVDKLIGLILNQEKYSISMKDTKEDTN